LRDCYQQRALAFEALGRFEDSSASWKETYDRTMVINDSTRHKEMEAMQAQYEVKESEKELELSNLEREQQKIIFVWGMCGAGILLLLLVAFVYGKIKNNKRLSEKNAIIQKSLSEKEILLKEIHHRVKNNLQVISSLLSMQSREIEDPAALEAVNESRNRVKSMAIIHQNLYQEDNLTGIDVGDYVEKLSRSLFASYRIDDDVIILKTDIDHLNLDVDTTIPLGLILNELITNALKYAFESREEGILEVKLKERSDYLELIVSDNGVGISNVKEKRGDSFGMKMIETFAQKLEAEFDVQENNGTTVSLRIRKYKKAS
jgi:two-component sensor histidine kinase